MQQYWKSEKNEKLQKRSLNLWSTQMHSTKRSPMKYGLRLKNQKNIMDYGHTMAKSQNKNLGFGYKGLVFCRNNGWLMENIDKGLGTKMGVDKLAKNTPNAPKRICPNCLPKPKSLGFLWKKASLGVRSPWPNLCWTQMHGLLDSNVKRLSGGRPSLFDHGWIFLLKYYKNIFQSFNKAKTILILFSQHFIST